MLHVALRCHDAWELLFRRREIRQLRLQRTVGQSQEQVAHRAGHLVVAQGPPAIGTVSEPDFYEQTGVATVRGVSAEWGSGPGETSLRWVENGQGLQVMSSNLDVEGLFDIANSLTLAE